MKPVSEAMGTGSKTGTGGGNNREQCPSTVNKDGSPKKSPERRRRATPTLNGKVGGPKVWRSLDEVADTPEFRELLERELPAGTTTLAKESRRDFLKFMGAGLALAGAATIPGCRRPDHKIYTYSREVPEDSIPGKPLFFATSMPLPGGGAEGLLVETHDGRPTKIEGNPLHPVNKGKTTSRALSSILSIYDPDRVMRPEYRNPARGVLPATWDDFKGWSGEHFATYDANSGAGLALILDKKTSPTRDNVVLAFRQRFPRARVVYWESADRRNTVEGSGIAFGRPYRAVPKLENAHVVVSLDHNPISRDSSELIASRGVASLRRPMKAGDRMSRLYAIETSFTEFGSMADHRLKLPPSRIAAFAVELARVVMERAGGNDALRRALAAVELPEPEAHDHHDDQEHEHHAPSIEEYVEAIAEDLLGDDNRGHSLVMAGESLPAPIHALVHALNDALGNAGRTVEYRPMGDVESADSMSAMADLAAAMSRGEVSTAICVGVNPVYDAPADLDFARWFEKTETTVTWAVGKSETAQASTWRLNGATYLESWGDTEAVNGTVAPVQPMIAPLYDPAMSEIEFLAMLAGDIPGGGTTPDGYTLVRDTWRRRLRMTGESQAAEFDKRWKRALHDGVLAGSAPRAASPSLDWLAVGRAFGSFELPQVPKVGALEVVFATGELHDGRYANVSWLQELPQTGTRVVWDNPALVSPKTAESLKLEPFGGAEDPYTRSQLPKTRQAKFVINGREIVLPVWVMPGMADDTVILTLGYGRTACGHVGDGVGFDVSPVRSWDSPWVASGATAERAAGSYTIASTQNHWSMEGRTSIVRQIDKPYWDRYGDEKPQKVKDKIYGAEMATAELNLAEQMGELAHTPANLSIYDNPYNDGKGDPEPGATVYNEILGREMKPEFARGPQWAMSIDQSVCAGCGACTIACQSENNIPVVGKNEVAKGREMQWIRVDRYFIGDDLNSPEQMVHQPVACVHCENAPCEVVCPFNATVHGPSGTNDMVYNRCVGTRYCANNCPYKVRRYNFFDYAQAKYNGGLVGDLEKPEFIENENLIPPRLRKQLDEIQKMKMNPDVTIRSRGVMEKCTYCIQRINAARFEVKLRDMDMMPDGFLQTACQQACSMDAISFGDMLDETSRVAEERKNNRSYLLLGYLNTRPRTTHMLRVNNPNPALREAVDPLKGHGHGGGHDDHGDSHGENGHDEGHAFFDPRQRSGDKGYALSLRVLGTGAPA
ncbi:MAG: TAT-variant-translocated molybdopterin oxidoreductase [Planctomycetota bacterium]